MSPFVFFFCSINNKHMKMLSRINVKMITFTKAITFNLVDPTSDFEAAEETHSINYQVNLQTVGDYFWTAQYYVENLVADNQSTSICF